jgi:hypothetical protein
MKKFIKNWITKDEELTNRLFTKTTQIRIKLAVVLIVLAGYIYIILREEGVL